VGTAVTLGSGWKAIRARFRSTLRYKLLVLVLFPTLLAMPATLGLTIYWFSEFGRDNLFLKAKSDSALARHALRQIELDYSAVLQRLAESSAFRSMLEQHDAAALQQELQALVHEEGFSFVHLTDEVGHWLYETRRDVRQSSKPSPLTDRALRGRPAAALEVFAPEDLAREAPRLLQQVRVLHGETGEESADRSFDERALVLRAVQPVKDARDRVLAFLDGGVVLNGNSSLIENLRARVYGAGTLPKGGLGAVAILLNNMRISTSFSLNDKQSAVGTQVSQEIRNQVVGEGSTVVTRDRIGGHWYISAYEPLFDVDGQGVAILQTGFLQEPFRAAQYRAVGLLLLIFLVLIGVSTWVALHGAKAIFKPIEQMTGVVRATQQGLDRRISDIRSQDEIGELARQFNAMLDLLQERNREIQRAADHLELQVEKRTRQLEKKNNDLQTTVRLLHQTRQRLLTAEKLASLGQMAAGIAHEINNPTAVILGHVDLLVSELGNAAGGIQGDIDMIIQQCERIRYIVDSLLQFARPNPPEDEIDVEDVDVNRAVEDTLPLVRHALQKVPVKVNKRLRTRRNVRIRRYELQEVLINLLLNAARASSANGAINITTADWNTRGVVISVRDNGVGIAPENIGRVFDPFFTTDISRGTGLGLAVSYGLIRRYGGEITVESEPGHGSVFHVWLLQHPVLAEPQAMLEYSTAR
jgi:two-component system, NtrC family, sensor kinase